MDVVVNYWALVGCVVYSMALGMLWYGPLFGALWSREMGWTEADKQAVMANPGSMYRSYALTALASLVMAYVLHHVITFGNAYAGSSGVESGLMGALWCWLGFMVPVLLNEVLFGKKTWIVFGINVAYYLVLLMGMAAILAYIA
jgi:hypothetical protein